MPQPRARIGDYVWNDSNPNGIQETGESGVQGVTVNLYTSPGTLVASTITDASGKYYFDVSPGQYYVEFVKPSGYVFSPKDQGSDNTIDSDANTTTGKTEIITVGPGQTDLIWDAGIHILTSSGTGTPGYWKNHPEVWPAETITIGGKVYNRAEAITIMGTPEKGDKTYTMFRALVSAELNVMIGNPDSCIAKTILEADDWMKKYGPAGKGVKASSAVWKQGEPLYTKLDSYNNGYLCAPHRD